MQILDYVYRELASSLKIEVYLEYRVHIAYPRPDGYHKWKHTTEPHLRRCGESDRNDPVEIAKLVQKTWEEILKEASTRTLVHQPEYLGTFVIQKKVVPFGWKP